MWTVGGAGGELAVDTARLGAAVVAVQAQADARARTAAAARRHAVEVEVVPGEGPEALGGLPEPDAVVIESGGAELVRAVAARRPGRLVLIARNLAEAADFRQIAETAGYHVDGALLQSAPLTPARADRDRPSFGPADHTLILWGRAG